MTKTVFGKVMWVGRATVFLVGLAVILALVFGVAVTALAGTGVGAPFNLGKVNSVNAVSTLVGSASGPMLKVDNNAGAGTAIRLETEPGRPPMSVNSSAVVTGLNSDMLDGQDASSFLPAKTYTKESTSTGFDIGGGVFLHETYCDAGDTILSGGHFELDPGTTLVASGPNDFHEGWQIQWKNDGTADSITISAYCADFGTPH